MIFDKTELAQAFDNIKTEYTIVGDIFYFSQIKTHNGENALVDYLHSVRKDKFCPTDRIVLVQDIFDEYEYDTSSDTPGNYLTLIQTYLEKLDITNCFVLIMSTNSCIEKEIDSVSKLYSPNDSTLINCMHIPGQYEKNIHTQETFCVDAWKGFFLKPDAHVLPCCIYQSDSSLGNLKTDSLANILHSSEANALRKNMLENRKSPGCKSCYNYEKHGKESRRLLMNKKYSFTKEHAKKITCPDGSIEDLNFESLELSLDNTCNLKCRVCSGESSSLLAIEEANIFGRTHNKNKILTPLQKNKIVDAVLPYVLRTKKIGFYGGEPLLQRGHYNILEYIIQHGAQKNIALTYSTNATNLYYKKKSILDYWNMFDDVSVSLSIDGHGKSFEYLRHGANWSTVNYNINQIKNHCSHVKLSLTSVVSSISLESIIELQKIFHTTGLINANSFAMNMIEGHNGNYDVQTLPYKHKKRLGFIIDEYVTWLKDKNILRLANEWQEINNYMHSADKSYKLIQTKRDIEILDANRNENFYDVFPKLQDMFNDIIITAN